MLLHARTQILGAGDDARYYTWLGWRIGQLIAHGHVVPFHVGDVIPPFGLDLRLLDGYLPSYVSGLFNLVVGPVLAFNLTFVTGRGPERARRTLTGAPADPTRGWCT